VVKGFNQKGFTLIEVIVTLVLVSIVGAMVVSFMGTQVTQSGRSVTWMTEELELSSVMERMLADYREELKEEPPNWTTFFGDRDTEGEINNLYTATIDYADIELTAFTEDNPGNPSTDYTESGADPAIHKLTLKKGDQTLITIFTE